MVKSGQQNQYSSQETHKVKEVNFSVMSEQEIIANSVCEVFEKRIYDYETMEPLPNGLNDPRMGVSNLTKTCETCEENSIECPGHFGHIRLAKPVYHKGFLEYVKKILSCVCKNCSMLLFDKSNTHDLEKIRRIKNGKLRLKEMVKACEQKKKCQIKKEKKNQSEQNSLDGKEMDLEIDKDQGCGCYQPKYFLEKLQLKIDPRSYDDEDETMLNERTIYAHEVISTLKKISDEDCELLGLNHVTSRPENLIITVLPVGPPAMRPSIQMDAISRSEDDLTHQYLQILKINDEIRNLEQKGAPSAALDKQIDYLQLQISCLFDNELNGVPRATLKSGKSIKSIRERLKGKEGRLRKNLMGKRVDFSARTVVSPDPNLTLEELGVPRSIALNLTIPETVTSLNTARLKELVINGPTQWPGAKTIKRTDGKVFDLRSTNNREDIQLNPGYIIERHLQDGDYVIFNRQPSLHRMSMMGHRIRILPFSSFRLNLSVTTPYNADFDGDEMNMHVPQTYETKTEVKYIMSVKNQIISPQANKPVMGIVQDSLVGIRLMTKRDCFLTKEQVMNLLLFIDNQNITLPQPAILKPEQLWTGKQIISLVLPEVNLEKKCNVASSNDEYQLFLKDHKVVIDKGELLSGMLDKGVVGNANGGVIHYIWLDYGADEAAKFLSNAQMLVNNWLCNFGFSVGVSDIFPTKQVQNNIIKELQKADQIVDQKIQEAMDMQLDSQPGKSIFDTFEANVNKNLNELFQTTSQQAQSIMDDRNRIYSMVAAGSKGSNLNITQIMACAGQQNVEGRRIYFGFKDRTLPHFNKDDLGPSSKGFVLNSYLTGLTPSEFFFHAMGGREGIIDTAVKTSETGYVQRKLIKALEDIMVKYDGTVRDSSGNIIQFIYGEDGNNGEYIENCVHHFHEIKDNEFVKEYKWIDTNLEIDFSDQLYEYQRYFTSPVIQQLLQNPQDTIDRMNNEYLEIEKARKDLRIIFPNLENRVYLPVNIPRLIRNVKAKHQLELRQIDNIDYSPLDVIEKVEEMIQRVISDRGTDSLAIQIQKNSTYLLMIMVRLYLSSKRVILKEKLSLEMLDFVLGDIESKYKDAQVNPGEMTGIISAQSLGEPTTQMTLNTFHFAGVSAKNVTLGVPRLKEILQVATNIKTPSMMIYLKETEESEHMHDDQMSRVQRMQQKLEYTTLGQLAKESVIYFDPDPYTTVIKEDIELMEMYIAMPDEGDQMIQKNLSSWLLRIVFNFNDLLDRDLGLQEIKKQILSKIDNLQIILDDGYGGQMPVLRIRLITSNTEPQVQLELLKQIEQSILNDLSIKGIQNIKKVFLKKNKNKQVDQDGQIKEREEWILETDGTNLKKVQGLEEVDQKRTSSNHNLEIFQVLGIEAARLSLIKEIRVILDAYNIYVNYRHITTLCDLMTTRGILTSISRHGINRVVDGPFRRASFEESVEILFAAAVFSEKQRFRGLTENIMYGQLAPLGTGSFDLLLDINQNEKQVYIPDSEIHIDMRDNIHIIDHQETNYNINTPDIMNLQSQTPILAKTPNVYESMGQSNFGQYGSVHFQGQFTPQTPGIETKTEMYNQFISQKMDSMSNSNQPLQFFNTRSSAFDYFKAKSPSYSPNISNDPRYSPQDSSQQMVYSPTNSRFNAQTVSPSYVNSQQPNRLYTPASPSYLNQPYNMNNSNNPNMMPTNSPSYSQNYLPSSPAYTGTTPLSINNSPSSGIHSNHMIHSGMMQNQSGSGNVYSPLSRQAVNNIYNPTSPVYNPNNAYVKQDVMYSDNEDDHDEEDK